MDGACGVSGGCSRTSEWLALGVISKLGSVTRSNAESTLNTRRHAGTRAAARLGGSVSARTATLNTRYMRPVDVREQSGHKSQLRVDDARGLEADAHDVLPDCQQPP